MSGISSLNRLRAHRIALTLHCLGERRGEGCSCQLLDDHLGYLELALDGDHHRENVGQVQEMLLELSLIIRSGALEISGDGYRRILDRLGGIYAGGMERRHGEAYALTAADYADVVEAIANRLGDYDYSRIIGQLLFYMARLYLGRKGSWVTIYEHLSAMPDGIDGISALKRDGFAEIHRWAEEGVANLFQIQRDIEARQRDLEEKVGRLQRRIAWLRRQCASDPDRPFAGQRVARLADYRSISRIRALEQELALVHSEQEGKRKTARLIESNIREFEVKLQAARRAYLIRPVG